MLKDKRPYLKYCHGGCPNIRGESDSLWRRFLLSLNTVLAFVLRFHAKELWRHPTDRSPNLRRCRLPCGFQCSRKPKIIQQSFTAIIHQHVCLFEQSILMLRSYVVRVYYLHSSYLHGSALDYEGNKVPPKLGRSLGKKWMRI
jgi:hypothetical protein